MYDSPQSRRLLVEDGLIGAITTYSVNEVFLYPVIDNLILLLQQPLIVSFYHRSPRVNEPKFTTLLDPGLRHKLRKPPVRPAAERFMVPIPRTEFSACFQTIDTSSGIRQATLGALEPGQLGQFEQIFSDLYVDASYVGLKALDAIGQGLDRGPDKFRAEPLPAGTDAPSEDEVREMLEPMRKVITEAYADYKDSPLISYLKGPELPITNLFCVVRNSIDGSRSGLFNYTARVMLSDVQKEQIARRFGSNEKLSEYLEYPLGMTARSFADYVFASGVLDFSSETPGQGRDQSSSEKDSQDRRRKEAERRIYEAITPEPKTFYIPIHIAGVPWLALFTLTPAPEDPIEIDPLSWAHNSLLYQILIPRIAERLRAGARLAYLQLIGRKFAEALSESDSSTLIARVNRAWERILRVYPHHGVRLAAAESRCANSLTLPDTREVCIKLYENPYYVRKINYDLLNISHVEDVCRRALQEAARQQVEVRSKFNERVLSQRHTIFNRTTSSLIEMALERGNEELSGVARDIVEDARRMTGVLETSLWIALREGLRGNHPLREVKTVLQLLRWLQVYTPSFELRPVLTVAEDVEDTIINEEQLADSFTVLWNLWHNASKTYGLYEPATFQVNVAQAADGMVITFINEGYNDLTQAWLDYLLAKTESPNKKKGPELRGLEIVNQRLRSLGWSIRDAKIEGEHTHVSVLVPKNRVPPRGEART
jgi:hypothetical protein